MRLVINVEMSVVLGMSPAKKKLYVLWVLNVTFCASPPLPVWLATTRGRKMCKKLEIRFMYERIVPRGVALNLFPAMYRFGCTCVICRHLLILYYLLVHIYFLQNWHVCCAQENAVFNCGEFSLSSKLILLFTFNHYNHSLKCETFKWMLGYHNNRQKICASGMCFIHITTEKNPNSHNLFSRIMFIALEDITLLFFCSSHPFCFKFHTKKKNA